MPFLSRNDHRAALDELLDSIEELECDHVYVPVADEMGDPQLAGGWVDCSYMACLICGHTRAITDDDLRVARDESHADAFSDHLKDLLVTSTRALL